jgi:hypothetical protein
MVEIDKIYGSQWAIVGDFNELPGNGCAAGVLPVFGGRIAGSGKPTRWEGQREIDYMIHRVCGPVEVRALEYAWSDHIPLEFTFRSHRGGQVSVRSVDAGHRWTLPAEIDGETWKETLSSARDEAADYDSARRLQTALADDPIDVDQEWEWFCDWVQQTFRLAATAAGVQGADGHKPNTFGWRQKRLATNRRAPEGDHRTMSIVKRRRKIARCYDSFDPAG